MTSATVSINSANFIIVFINTYFSLYFFSLQPRLLYNTYLKNERNNATFILYLSATWKCSKNSDKINSRVVKNKLASERSVTNRHLVRLNCIFWRYKNTFFFFQNWHHKVKKKKNVTYNRWRIQWNHFIRNGITTEILSKIGKTNVCRWTATWPHRLSATPNRRPTRYNWWARLANTWLTRFGAPVYGEIICTRGILQLQHHSKGQSKLGVIQQRWTEPQSKRWYVPLYRNGFNENSM